MYASRSEGGSEYPKLAENTRAPSEAIASTSLGSAARRVTSRFPEQMASGISRMLSSALVLTQDGCVSSRDGIEGIGMTPLAPRLHTFYMRVNDKIMTHKSVTSSSLEGYPLQKLP